MLNLIFDLLCYFILLRLNFKMIIVTYWLVVFFFLNFIIDIGICHSTRRHVAKLDNRRATQRRSDIAKIVHFIHMVLILNNRHTAHDHARLFLFLTRCFRWCQ